MWFSIRKKKPVPNNLQGHCTLKCNTCIMQEYFENSFFQYMTYNQSPPRQVYFSKHKISTWSLALSETTSPPSKINFLLFTLALKCWFNVVGKELRMLVSFKYYASYFNVFSHIKTMIWVFRMLKLSPAVIVVLAVMWMY